MLWSKNVFVVYKLLSLYTKLKKTKVLKINSVYKCTSFNLKKNKFVV